MKYRNLLMFLWLVVVTILPYHTIQAFRVTSIEVPKWLVIGQRATLRCFVDLEGEKLYSVTWWKDGRQFFQYNPNKKGKEAVTFTVPGISVNPRKSTLDLIELVDVQQQSTGEYRCEAVADIPTFTTSSLSSNMTILDAPDSRPIIFGLEDSYKSGDLININCTSLRSSPPAELQWTIKGEKVLDEYLINYSIVEEEDDPPLYTSTLGFSLIAQRNIFPRGFLNLRCTATVQGYQWTTDVTIHFDVPTLSQPHHLPTQLQTGGSTSTRSFCSQYLVLYNILQFFCMFVYNVDSYNSK